MLLSIPLDRAALWRGLPPIMQAVADEFSCRYDFSEPWIHEGHVYATDGKIGVRVRLDDLLSVPRPRDQDPGERFQKVVRAMPALFVAAWQDEPTPIPYHELPAVEACPVCHGGGIGPIEDSDRVFRLGECNVCDGEGWVTPLGDRIQIAEGLDLGERYVAILCDHFVTRVYRAVDPAVPHVYFRAGIVEGVLMPLDPESSLERVEREGREMARSR